jgi:hypothetical protein
MHAHSILGTRHFRWVCAAPDERGDHHGIAGATGRARKQQPVTNRDMRIGRQPFVDGDRTWRPLDRNAVDRLKQRCSEQQGNHA